MYMIKYTPIPHKHVSRQLFDREKYVYSVYEFYFFFSKGGLNVESATEPIPISCYGLQLKFPYLLNWFVINAHIKFHESVARGPKLQSENYLLKIFHGSINISAYGHVYFSHACHGSAYKLSY